MRRRQRGVTLWELAIAIAILGLIFSAVAPALTNMFDHMRWFRMQSFKSIVTEAMNGYHRDNIREFIDTGSVTVTVSANDLLLYSPAGTPESGFGADSQGRNWSYVPSCAQTLAAPVSLAFCDFIGFTTPATATVAATAERDLQWYRSNPDVDDLIYISGRPSVLELVNETIAKAERVRAAMENYYRSLHLATPDKGIGINRFARQSAAGGPNAQYLFDFESVLRNTEINPADDHLFTPDEASALGLSESDLITPFGPLRFDNGSPDVRSPDNGDVVPFTAHIWVDLPGGDSILVIATSVF